MSPKDADGMTNSVDPDQTAPPGSGSTLFRPVGKFSNITVIMPSVALEKE